MHNLQPTYSKFGFPRRRCSSGPGFSDGSILVSKGCKKYQTSVADDFVLSHGDALEDSWDCVDVDDDGGDTEGIDDDEGSEVNGACIINFESGFQLSVD